MSITILGIKVELDSEAAKAQLEALRQRLAAFANTSGLSKHSASVRDVAGEYSKLSAQLLAVKSATAVLTAAVAGAVPVMGQMAVTVGAAFGTALATANVAGMSKELESLHRSTDISRQSLQEWRLAARFEGIGASLNEFGDMSGVFVDIGEAVAKLGTKEGEEFAATLSQIGLSVDDLRGKKADEALLLIGQALDKSGLTGKQQENILAGISDDAGKLLPLLKSNSAALNEIKLYASAVGAIQSDAQLDAMRQTNTELSFFKAGLEGVQTQLAAVGSNVVNTLGPDIRQLFIDARQPIEQWSQAASAAVAKFKADLDATGSWTMAIKLSLKDAYPTLYGFIASAADFGRGYGQAFINPMLDELKRGYASIRGALGEAGGAESLGKGLGEAMLPVVGIVRNVTDAVQLLIANWDQLKAVAAVTPVGFAVAHWDKVTAVFGTVGLGIKAVAGYFGLLNPATLGGASGMQVFSSALLGLVAAGASTRLALGAVGAAFNVLRFAVAPVTLALSVAPAAFAALATAAGVAGRALQVLALAARLNPLVAGVTAVAAVAGVLVANWDRVGPFFSSLWSGVTGYFKKAFGDIANTPWHQVPQKILGGFATLHSDLFKLGVKAIGELAVGIMTTVGVPEDKARAVVGGVVTQVQALPGKLWDIGVASIRKLADAISAGIGQVSEIGANIAAGLAEGIRNKAASVVEAARNMAGSAVDAVTGFFKIRSPSRLMMEHGGYVSEGLAVGIEQGSGRVVGAVRSVSSQVEVEFARMAEGVNAVLTNSFMSLDFGSLGSSLSALFKQQVVQPLLSSALQPLSSGIAGVFGGLKGSIGAALGLGGASGGSLMSSITGSLGGLFGGGSGLTGALSGVGSALGGIASALGPVGIAAGAIAALSSIIGKPQGNIVFGQGMAAGQQLTGQGGHGGQGHYRESVFGLLGATSDSNKIGREKDFVPKFHLMMDQMVALDKMIATALPRSLNDIKAALQGVTQSGFSTSDMLKGRYTAVFSALPAELQAAMQGGKNLMAGSADEIVARFGLMAAAAQSVVPALDQLGLNAGKTKESAIAAALGLTDLMGGIDKVKDSAGFYYQEFFTEEERKTQLLRTAGADVAAFNRQLGLTGSAAINTHAEFVKYVASLDLTTAAGREAYASAMSVAGSMDVVADAYKAKVLVLQQALPALENLNLRIGNTGSSALAAVNGLASLMGGVDKLTQAANTYYDQFFSDEEKKNQALANAAADVDRFNQSLGLSGKNAIDTHAEFRKYTDGLNLQTEAGRKAFAEAMKIVGSMDALADTGKSLDDVIGTLPKKLYAKALAMSGLSDAVDKAASGSTEALNDVKRSMGGLGVAAGKTARAIEGFVTQALKAAGLLSPSGAGGGNNGVGGIDGSHADGLGYVPKDGYIARLHRGEMVLTAQQATNYRSGGAQMAVSVQPQLRVVVNNNSAAVNVRVDRSHDGAGNPTAVLSIEDIETALLDRAKRGKGLAGSLLGRR